MIVLDCTPEQVEVIRAKETFLTLIGGRRWGKTIGVIDPDIVTQSLERPGFQYLFVAPSYARIKKEHRRISKHRKLQSRIHSASSQPVPGIIWENGSYTEFRSLDRHELLRGDGWHKIAVDEIQNIKEEIINEVLLPMIADSGGQLLLSGQFRGMEHWIYERFFMPGQEGPQKREDYRSWLYPSETGRVFQGEEGKKRYRRMVENLPSTVVDQECRCIPSANAACVFRPTDLNRAKRGEVKTQGVGGYTYILSIDLGRVADPSALCILEQETKTYVHAEIRPKGEYHEQGAKHAAFLMTRYQPCLAIIDATGGAKGGQPGEQEEFIKFYRDQIPNLRAVIFTRASKQRFVECMMLGLEKDQVSMPAALAEMRRQFSQYEYERKGDGYIYHGPDGHADDLVSAAMMAWYAHQHQWGPVQGGISLGQVMPG